jgi:hypothetical protein
LRDTVANGPSVNAEPLFLELSRSPATTAAAASEGEGLEDGLAMCSGESHLELALGGSNLDTRSSNTASEYASVCRQTYHYISLRKQKETSACRVTEVAIVRERCIVIYTHLVRRARRVPLSAHLNRCVDPQHTALGACSTGEAPELISIALDKVETIKNYCHGFGEAPVCLRAELCSCVLLFH